MTGFEGWTPTAANVNALPDPVLRYVQDLETRCDPTGDVQEQCCLRENAALLECRLERAEVTIASLREALALQERAKK